MPSGPPELHEFWTNYGPTEDGDTNAIMYLNRKGYKLTNHWNWIPPTPDVSFLTMPQKDYDAICYLIWEWDFGGLVRA